MVDPNCKICFDCDEDPISDVVEVSVCIHTFHAHCYFKMVVLQRDVRCPMCRRYLGSREMTRILGEAFARVRLADMTEEDFKMINLYRMLTAKRHLLEDSDDSDDSGGE